MVEYAAMEGSKEHGLGELLDERGEGDCRHFRGGSATSISANSGAVAFYTLLSLQRTATGAWEK